MSKILVTGGAGFIGSWLVEKLAEKKENLIVIADNLSTGNKKNIPASPFKNVNFVQCDINNEKDIAPLFASHSFDYVFHFAAVVGVNRTLKEPIKVLNDINGIRNILDLSKNTSVKRVFYSSSSEVYGEPFEIPQNEQTTPLNSRLPYAIVKNVGEAFFRSYHHEYSLDYTIFRFFNTYGPRQSIDFVIPKFIHSAINGNEILIYGDGKQSRTFCYIEDSISACLKAFYNNHYINDVVNIGSPADISIIELAKTIINICQSSSKLIFTTPLKEGDMTRRQPDLKRMKKIFDGKLKSLEEGIYLTIKYLFPNMENLNLRSFIPDSPQNN